MKTKPHLILGRTARWLPAVLAALLISSSSALAMPTITTLGGGDPNINPPYKGYRDGATLTSALFNNPVGLTIDSTGNFLFVADKNNNAIRRLDLVQGQTATFVPTYQNGSLATNEFNAPQGTVIDSSSDLFVLNYADGTHGNLVQFNYQGQIVATNLANISNAGGITIDSLTNIYLTANNQVIAVSPNAGTHHVVATIIDAGANLKGICFKHNGLLGVCDLGRNGILLVDPVSGQVTTNAGFHGQGDYIYSSNFSYSNNAEFFQPHGIAETGDGTMIVCDYGNHRIKAVLPNGIVTNICGVSSNYWGGSFPGWFDHQVVIPDNYTVNGVLGQNAQDRLPNGVAFGPDGTIYVSEDFYHLIRKITGAGLAQPPPPPQPPPAAPLNLTVTATNFNTISLQWTASANTTNYLVERAPSHGGPYSVVGSTAATSFTDTTVLNGTPYYYVVVAQNQYGNSTNSNEVVAETPLPPVPNPQIGYVDFPSTASPVAYTSVFHPESSFIFNNDALIVIVGAAGSQTYYTYGPTPTNGAAGIPDPNSSSASAPSGYQDGLGVNQAQQYGVAQILPDITIKAIGEKNDGSPNSAIVSSRFQFIVGNPIILGNNAAFFTISDITSGAHLFYTTDGSDPSSTNANAVDLGVSVTSSNTWSVSLPITSDTIFKVRAFRDNYTASSIVTNVFLVANFQPTTISFGFAAGEGSSAYIASPGQTYYAPVTMSLVGGPTVYSLQFNLTVTNGLTNSGPPVAPNAFGFQSMLLKPVPGISPTVYEDIPPAMFAGGQSVPNPISLDGSTDFSSLLSTNTGLNLLGVGWIERAGATNLYDTTKQTLLSLSLAHDDLFASSGGKVIVGGYSFVVPAAAQSNQTYTIQIGRPSGTTDGIGTPGSSIFISAPINGGNGPGTVNALKTITVGQFRYLVGSTYPFRWFNAGDFGSTNIVNADVEQVFQSAVYGVNTPPDGSDLLDAMDSSGNIGALDQDPADPNNGYYTNSAVSYATTYGSYNPLFDGNDTTINQDIFGDGVLDVSDVYVTFRRGLDPSLTWYRRFWNNNGQRIADTGLPNVAAHGSFSKSQGVVAKVQAGGTNGTSPFVTFTAGDIVGTAGSTVQVPIIANIVGKYPLRVLMLNLTVTPLDGAPALTSQVTFSQTATLLGTPYDTHSDSFANYASVWLNSTNSGLSNSITLGTLSVPIPANADPTAAYAVHFDHASGSPNGLASFPNTKVTGLVSTHTETNSCYKDGIPDSWRLRWFGTTNNLLSVSNACPSGDGVSNWAKYLAGVDPNVANDFPKLQSKSSPAGYNSALHWPTVSGQKYVIQRSSQLYGAPWTILSTNIGTGTDMEYDDSYTNKTKFYRVFITH